MFSDSNGTTPDSRPEGMRLLDLAGVLLAHRRRILAVAAGAVLLGLPLAILLPKKYVARTLLVASSDGGGVSSQILSSQLPTGIPAGLVGGRDPQHDLVGVVVRSRSLADSAVLRLAPGNGPEAVERSYEIRNALAYATDVDAARDGSMKIAVTARDPELAARIANLIPELVNRIMSSISAREALNKQEFLELQLSEATEALERSEEKLVEFQVASAAPEIQEQARQTVEAAAELQQEILRQEIQVAQLRRTLTPDHPELRAAIDGLSAARTQLRRFTTTRGSQGNVFLSMEQTPQLKAEAMRLLREHTRNEQVVISLTAGLAQARVDARNTLPTVTVLDAALVPRQPTGAGIFARLIFAALLGLVFGIAWVVVSEMSRRARRDPENESFFVAWDRFRSEGPLPLSRR